MRFAPLLAGLTLLSTATLARAGDLDFVVPDNDGYGIATCMRPGEACGQVIADAWCEAHGHARATAFGLGDDVTGTVPAAVAPPVPPGSILIRCGE